MPDHRPRRSVRHRTRGRPDRHHLPRRRRHRHPRRWCRRRPSAAHGEPGVQRHAQLRVHRHGPVLASPAAQAQPPPALRDGQVVKVQADGLAEQAGRTRWPGHGAPCRFAPGAPAPAARTPRRHDEAQRPPTPAGRGASPLNGRGGVRHRMTTRHRRRKPAAAVRALRTQQAEVAALCDGFGAGGALQFPVDRGDVCLHGIAGGVQLLADLGEREVGRQ
jgi:hypothetical protein